MMSDEKNDETPAPNGPPGKPEEKHHGNRPITPETPLGDGKAGVYMDGIENWLVDASLSPECPPAWFDWLQHVAFHTIPSLRDEIDRLRAENIKLREENGQLREENDRLTSECREKHQLINWARQHLTKNLPQAPYGDDPILRVLEELGGPLEDDFWIQPGEPDRDGKAGEPPEYSYRRWDREDLVDMLNNKNKEIARLAEENAKLRAEIERLRHWGNHQAELILKFERELDEEDDEE